MGKRRKGPGGDDEGGIEDLTLDLGPSGPRKPALPDRPREPERWDREESKTSPDLVDQVIARQKRAEERRRNPRTQTDVDDPWGTEIDGEQRDEKALESLWTPKPGSAPARKTQAKPETSLGPLPEPAKPSRAARPLPVGTQVRWDGEGDGAPRPLEDHEGPEFTLPIPAKDEKAGGDTGDSARADEGPDLSLDGLDPGRRDEPRPRIDPPAAPRFGAGIGRRFLAAVVDFTIIVAAAGLFLIVARVAFGWERMGRLDGDQVLSVELAVFPLAVNLFLIAAIYFTANVTLFGQTVGKRLLRLRVVDQGEGGGAVAWPRAFLRFVLSFVVSPGFAWVAVDPSRQAVHDKLVGTLVIRDGTA